ncbi:MAG: 4'-phosphopantetheinyl transferase superfamily protein [Magnetococcales bacterium]|nr:4'-phosphopantetheinyl transferase superfamily protein [Magnetococcales bacterium]
MSIDGVVVWGCFPSEEIVLPPLLESMLDRHERRRAERLINPRDGRRFTLSHALLRLVLAHHTGLDPAAIIYRRTQHGKPYLAGGPAFNMSHSGAGVLMAVGPADPIGIDVERPRPMADRDGVVDRFFSEQEQRAYDATPVEDRHVAFFNIWTRKEAYLKAFGHGLRWPLEAFSVSHGQAAMVTQHHPLAAGKRVIMHHLSPADGHRGALVISPDATLAGGTLISIDGKGNTIQTEDVPI